MTAEVSFRWDALQTARTATTEEDLLYRLSGRDDLSNTASKQPWLRVDVVLHATLPWGQERPMPSASTWAKFIREAQKRFEGSGALVSTDEGDDDAGIRGWQGEPEVEALCHPDGKLRIKGVSLPAWQAIDLPRRWDDPDREPDDDPQEQLVALFGRLRRAIPAWMEVLGLLL